MRQLYAIKSLYIKYKKGDYISIGFTDSLTLPGQFHCSYFVPHNYLLGNVYDEYLVHNSEGNS